jgi:hypothetical protein
MNNDSNSPLKKSNKEPISGWEVVDAIKSLRPNAIYNMDNSEFTQYFDHDGQRPPTLDEILAEAERLRTTLYQRQRFPEYPNLLDFVDAYYWQQKGDSSKMDSYISKVDAVKAKYPKP